jgi:hypothetical protein
MATVIRGSDNFDSTPPSHGRVVRTAGSFTTTSTSLVDAIGATLTLTTGANPVFLGSSKTTYNSSSGEANYFTMVVDSTLLNGNDGIATQFAGANQMLVSTITAQTEPLSAGSHTFKEQWRVSGGTGRVEAISGRNYLFYAHEVK